MERRCLVCDHIFTNERPVCHVVFFDDGEIQVDCGHDDHGDDENFSKSFRPVGLGHIIARDKTLVEIFTHETAGISFGRDSVGGVWTKYFI